MFLKLIQPLTTLQFHAINFFVSRHYTGIRRSTYRPKLQVSKSRTANLDTRLSTASVFSWHYVLRSCRENNQVGFQFCNNHRLISSLMTPPCHPLTYFGPGATGVKMPKCLCWIIFEAGFEDFIIMDIVGNCLGHIFVDEVNNCLEDFGFFRVWELSGIFKMEELEICFFAFVIDSPSCLRI